MIVIMKYGANESEITRVIDRIEELGFKPHVSRGEERTILGVVGVIDQSRDQVGEQLRALPEVERVEYVLQPFKLVARQARRDTTRIKVGSLELGGPKLQVIAGPCSVEDESQMLETAEAIKAAGATLLRGGAFKPSTSPYSFRGLKEDGLKLLAKARDEFDLPIVTEVMDTADVALVAEYADILQIGARNAQNYALLEKVGEVEKPVLLKRGFAETYMEWLQSAEYIAAAGNPNILLCERGIRTFETYTRNTFDVSAFPSLRELTHLPLVADPSHATGKRSLVAACALAAIAAGADVLEVEVHPNPETALKDGAQSLNFAEFERLMSQIPPVAQAVGRTL